MTIGSKALEETVQGQDAPEHCWAVILSRPGRSGGDEPVFPRSGRSGTYMTHSQHLALCGIFCIMMFCKPLQQWRSRISKTGRTIEPKTCFVLHQEEQSENWFSHFESKILLISF